MPQKTAPPRLLTLSAIAVVLIGGALAYRRTVPPPHAVHSHGGIEAGLVVLDQELGQSAQSDRLGVIKKHLEDARPGVRLAAVDALSDYPDAATTRLLMDAFHDNSSEVRLRALDGLLRRDPQTARPYLLAALRDDDVWMRETAHTQIISRFGRGPLVNRSALPLLIAGLSDPSPNVAQLALSGLRKVTGKSWFARKTAPEAERQKIIARWRQWWKSAEASEPRLPTLPTLTPTRQDPTPDFTLRTLSGETISPKTQHGKITLLNFWGTWCGACVSEVPDLQRVASAYADRGVQVVGIATGEDDGGVENDPATTVRRFLAEHHATYAQSLATEETVLAFDEVRQVPVTILMDGSGNIRYRWDGERDFATFQAAIERVLSEP